jgi:hypothetical protein
MGLDQQGISVFRVHLGDAGEWDVTEEGLAKPLASFASAKEALEYARDLAKARQGSTVKVFDEHGTQMPAEGTARMLPGFQSFA